MQIPAEKFDGVVAAERVDSEQLLQESCELPDILNRVLKEEDCIYEDAAEAFIEEVRRNIHGVSATSKNVHVTPPLPSEEARHGYRKHIIKQGILDVIVAVTMSVTLKT